MSCASYVHHPTTNVDCTDFYGTYSVWMDSLPSLDTVGRALDISQSNVPTLSEDLMVGGVGAQLEKKGGGEGMRTWISICNEKSLFLLKKK